MTYMRPPTTMTTKEVARQLTKYYASDGYVSPCSGLPYQRGDTVKASTISKVCKQGRLRGEKVHGEWQIREEDAAKLWPQVFDAAGGREG